MNKKILRVQVLWTNQTDDSFTSSKGYHKLSHGYKVPFYQAYPDNTKVIKKSKFINNDSINKAISVKKVLSGGPISSSI